MKSVAFASLELGLISLPAVAGFIPIDAFETSQQTEATGAPPATDGDVANPTATALGDERDIWTTKTLGSAGDSVTTRINPDGEARLRHSMDAGVRGSTRVSWDGIDGDADAIDFDGLGGLDFGVVSDGYFELAVTFNDLAGPVEIVVYDASDLTGATYATGIIDVAGGIDDLLNPTIYQLDFSDMSLFGGTAEDIFGNIGAITLTVDATAAGQGGRDVDLLYFGAYTNVPGVGVPVPASLPLMGLGLVALLAYRRRRNGSLGTGNRF